MSTDLIVWLRAQLDEDEQIARAVEDRSDPWFGQWQVEGNEALRTRNGWVLAHHRGERYVPGLLVHIARHDPARVLAEVDAKRRILDRHGPIELFSSMYCTYCGVLGGQRARDVNWPCPEILDAAAPYAARPGYRQEWAP